jgi:glycosyltransferase involved in cell wall biosynthesis
VYAAPARYEPFGYAPLEAALSGCALVLGDIPSFRELWEGAALFVDPDDPAEVAAAIRTLTAERRAARLWGERARERAQGLGGPVAFGCAHARLYEELVHAGSVSAT